MKSLESSYYSVIKITRENKVLAKVRGFISMLILTPRLIYSVVNFPKTNYFHINAAMENVYGIFKCWIIGLNI